MQELKQNLEVREMDWKNKKVRVLFQDIDKVLSKTGEVVDIDENFLSIETDRCLEIIPMSRVVRMEVLENANY